MNQFFTKVGMALIFFAYSCSSTNSTPVSVGFNGDSSSIVVSGISDNNRMQVQQMLQNNAGPANYLEVREGSERVSGRLSLNGDTLCFRPSQSFQRGHAYQVRTLLNSSFADTRKLLKNEMSYQVKALEVVLVR